MASGLTKSQFTAALSEAWGLSKKEAAEGYEKFVDLVYGEVRGKGELTLPGLGKLVKQNRAARMGRNPATGEAISIPAKTVVKFRLSKAAKEAIL
ncbi:DNA-binding protein [Candidatus Uhrbacteria bacterium CG10_big_fil_rev_8_21_14_0_10_50_16]|uniref:DNA-binding protein n=1 Tax=Candidatus Uhrbacteria bacterium CG10_big_fil_rev_8_21_14_0_10_50_16 TaxID=1975039 RepID=A0A2H0RNJ4_9BACT|nr:MAG: DNA-binding protein [Candidatus Uhrbacteria bacterium CG10_big_fil_rev_8_21_14_0_10_50_16]